MKSRDQYIASPLKTAALLEAVFANDAPKIIFDIGACEGLDSIRYSRLFPSSHVYAFEPLPGNVTKINENLTRFDGERISIVPKALARENGTATFHLSSGIPDGREAESGDWNFGNKSSSLIAPNKEEIRKYWPWLEFTGTTEVETITMDTFCSDLGIQPDFLHMDVQGAELEVLAAADNVLGKVRAIWMEVSLTEVYSGQPLADDVNRFMRDHGMVNAVTLPEGPQADVLYVRSGFESKIPADVVERLKRECTVISAPNKPPSTNRPSLLRRVINRLAR